MHCNVNAICMSREFVYAYDVSKYQQIFKEKKKKKENARILPF